MIKAEYWLYYAEIGSLMPILNQGHYQGIFQQKSMASPAWQGDDQDRTAKRGKTDMVNLEMEDCWKGGHLYVPALFLIVMFPT